MEGRSAEAEKGAVPYRQKGKEIRLELLLDSEGHQEGRSRPVIPGYQDGTFTRDEHPLYWCLGVSAQCH